MTRAEYLEFVQEHLGFPQTGVGSPDPAHLLYDTQDVVTALKIAHEQYCQRVAEILELPYQPLGRIHCLTDDQYAPN